MEPIVTVKDLIDALSRFNPSDRIVVQVPGIKYYEVAAIFDLDNETIIHCQTMQPEVKQGENG